MSGELRTPAPAKVNLTLEVLGRREDGYHDLVSIAQTVDLADTVTLARVDGDSRRQVRILDEAGRRTAIPFGEELVGRAWSILAERARTTGGGVVTVTKRVPVSGGLGGGSSDAAAFLRLAAERWSIPAGVIASVAAEVGSDVSLFLHGGTVWMEGRGEQVDAMPDAQLAPGGSWALLLYTPELPTPAQKTATMYGALRPSHFGDGRRARALRSRLAAGAAPGEAELCNTFDAVADEVLTGLRAARRRLAAAATPRGGTLPLLAGAGPSLFVVGEAGALAEAAADLNRSGGGRATVVRPLGREAATRVARAER